MPSRDAIRSSVPAPTLWGGCSRGEPAEAEARTEGVRTESWARRSKTFSNAKTRRSSGTAADSKTVRLRVTSSIRSLSLVLMRISYPTEPAYYQLTDHIYPDSSGRPGFSLLRDLAGSTAKGSYVQVRSHI